MTDINLNNLFDLHGRVAVVTGGGGELCSGMSQVLAKAGARVAVLDIAEEKSRAVSEAICASGGQAIGFACDVTNRASLENACANIHSIFGPVDILVNGAGGNQAAATTSPQNPFFELDEKAVRRVFELNFIGSFIPCQVFGKDMADNGRGCIVNIASMNAFRPLTRIPAYSAAKAAVVNFTQWLAVHMAQEYSPNIRVNAIAPGFFLTDQNRYLLIDAESKQMTLRGQKILEHTPMGRLGIAADLYGTLIWLCSPAAGFVTGIVVPVDGGFSAYSGV